MHGLSSWSTYVGPGSNSNEGDFVQCKCFDKLSNARKTSKNVSEMFL